MPPAQPGAAPPNGPSWPPPGTVRRAPCADISKTANSSTLPAGTSTYDRPSDENPSVPIRVALGNLTTADSSRGMGGAPTVAIAAELGLPSRRSRGWDPAIEAKAFCECAWEGPWRSWPTPGVSPAAAELISAELEAHRADTGHSEFPVRPTAGTCAAADGSMTSMTTAPRGSTRPPDGSAERLGPRPVAPRCRRLWTVSPQSRSFERGRRTRNSKRS
jgi:hypothetical protein